MAHIPNNRSGWLGHSPIDEMLVEDHRSQSQVKSRQAAREILLLPSTDERLGGAALLDFSNLLLLWA